MRINLLWNVNAVLSQLNYPFDFEGKLLSFALIFLITLDSAHLISFIGLRSIQRIRPLT